MKTIVEPKVNIDKLWGKQRVNETEVYRLMRYVLRVNLDGNVLLHNVVTGHLVVLEQDEAETVKKLPQMYNPVMNHLITEHYLVPEDYDEHYQVVNLRDILLNFYLASNVKSQGITNYTILPTTACNARCYYCFEHDVRPVTMTEQVADDTVRFISEHCGDDRKVSIRWFGGEPTVAIDRIDRICYGLKKCGINYTSSMTTNGYLFDEGKVSHAKELWNLKDVMISVDGTEKNYNDIKAYVNAKDNPYKRVLRNIGLLLDKEIKVNLRMNFDLDNYQDFKDLLIEAGKRYQDNKLLQVYAFPIKGQYPDKNGKMNHGSESWFNDKLVELNDMAREKELFYRKRAIPSLHYVTCSAGTASFMVVTAEGKLGRCTGIFNREDQIVGNVTDGEIDSEYCQQWIPFADPEKCRKCCLFPSCVLIEKCPGRDRCFIKETLRQHEETIKCIFNQWLNRYQDNQGGNVS